MAGQPIAAMIGPRLLNLGNGPGRVRIALLSLVVLCGCVAQEPYGSTPPTGGGASAGGVAGSLNIAPDPGDAGATGGAADPVETSIRCTSSADCAPPLPYCDLNIGSCVECTTNRNCSTTFRPLCDPRGYRCVSCLSDQQCTSLAPYCATALGECVECLASGNCGDSGLACDRLNYRCVPACKTNADCSASPLTPSCDPRRSLCVACSADADCPAAVPNCDVAAGTCVHCVDDADCDGTTPRCDTRKHGCAQCLTARDCPVGAVCFAGTCKNPK